MFLTINLIKKFNNNPKNIVKLKLKYFNLLKKIVIHIIMLLPEIVLKNHFMNKPND